MGLVVVVFGVDPPPLTALFGLFELTIDALPTPLLALLDTVRSDMLLFVICFVLIDIDGMRVVETALLPLVEL